MYQKPSKLNRLVKYLPEILGGAFAVFLVGVTAYQLACTPKSRIMARRLESELTPLRAEFTRIVEGDEYVSAEPFSIDRDNRGLDENKTMDYGEQLKRIITQRDSILAEHGCGWQGSWMSLSGSGTSAYTQFRGRVLHTNPFRSLEDI